MPIDTISGIMDLAYTGKMPSMLPDEEVIYKTSAGRLSFARRLPCHTVVVTNKRLFLIGPLGLFSKHSYYYYDTMESLNVKKSIVASKVTIRFRGGSKTLMFYNHRTVLATFNIVSNQILSVKDPNYQDKKKAHSLDMRYAVLNRGVVFEIPIKESVMALSKIARVERKRRGRGQRQLEPQNEQRRAYGMPRALFDQMPAPVVVNQSKSRTKDGVGMGLLKAFKTVQRHFDGIGIDRVLAKRAITEMDLERVQYIKISHNGTANTPANIASNARPLAYADGALSNDRPYSMLSAYRLPNTKSLSSGNAQYTVVLAYGRLQQLFKNTGTGLETQNTESVHSSLGKYGGMLIFSKRRERDARRQRAVTWKLASVFHLISRY